MTASAHPTFSTERPRWGITARRQGKQAPAPNPDTLSRAVAKVGVIRGAGALLHEGLVSGA